MRLIDLHNRGTDRSIGTWIVDDEIIVDPGPASTLPRLLAALDEGWQPRAIALTHIHLDHAGSTGALLERWPACEVWVHSRGARHLVDPSRLLESSRFLYGDQLEELFGSVKAVPEQAIRPLSDGMSIGPFEILDTPGHARHHVVYFLASQGVAFVGDVAGVRIPPSSFILPPTMPPEFDALAWLTSIDRLERAEPTRIVLTHFGAYDDVKAHLQAARESIVYWSEFAKDNSSDAFVHAVESEIAEVGDAGAVSAYRIAAAPDLMWLGAKRYWDQRVAT